MATIDKKLNLVLELELEDGSTAYVHSVPISRQVWQSHYTFLTVAITSLYNDGLTPSACARVCFLRMKELVEQDKDKFGRVPGTLFAEMWRLTNVVLPGERGYETVPFYDLMRGDKQLSEGDVEEVQNFLCFFTAASWVHGGNRKSREAFQRLLTEGFGVRITASPVMELMSSMPISNPVENTGEKETASSIPA